jgi:hypothetical protein
MSDTATPWKPQVRVDLAAGPQAFQHAVEQFRTWAAVQPRPVINLPNGWHTITPQLAEQLLLCNKHNRKLRWPDVFRYAIQMANKRWMKTGESIILTDQGDLEDAGHRLMACYLSNCSFESYVVSDVPHNDQLFAYIDNGVSRTGEDTLHCAGVNGLSNQLSNIIKKLAIPYEEKNLNYYGRMPVSPITNIDILDYAKAHPTLGEAAHLVRNVYPAAARRLDDRNVATFLAWKIKEAYGSGVLEDFFPMLSEESLPPTHPVAVLQKRLDEHETAKGAPLGSAKAKLKLGDTKILALAMLTFNLWREGKTVPGKKLNLGVEDPYPQIERPDEPEQLAAE